MMRSDTRRRVMAGPSWPCSGRSVSLRAAASDRLQGASNRNPALLGAIDFHVHELPDSENWRIDAIEMARDAVSRGMRGSGAQEPLSLDR